MLQLAHSPPMSGHPASSGLTSLSRGPFGGPLSTETFRHAQLAPKKALNLPMVTHPGTSKSLNAYRCGLCGPFPREKTYHQNHGRTPPAPCGTPSWFPLRITVCGTNWEAFCQLIDSSTCLSSSTLKPMVRQKRLSSNLDSNFGALHQINTLGLWAELSHNLYNSISTSPL